MIYMLAFLLISIVVGLWAPPKKAFTGLIVVLAVLLVLFFMVSPSKM